ncbi:MAG: hypothetical protein AB1938_26150 [Myxococcota bacterium]
MSTSGDLIGYTGHSTGSSTAVLKAPPWVEVSGTSASNMWAVGDDGMILHKN